MVKAKKAAPKKAKVTSSARKSIKRATSTPLSKANLLLVAETDTNSGVTIRKKGAKNVSKTENIAETPKRASPEKGTKRSGAPVDSILSDSSPKKPKKKIAVTKKKTDNDVTKTSVTRSGRTKKSPVIEVPAKDVAKSPPVVSGRKKGAKTKGKSAVNDSLKKSSTSPKKTASKGRQRKSKGVLATKAKRLSAVKQAATPKRGRKLK